MKSLGHVVGVDMVHRLQAEVGQGQLLAARDLLKDRGVEMPWPG